MLTNAEHVTHANYLAAVSNYTAGRGSLAAVEVARSEYARATDAGMILRGGSRSAGPVDVVLPL